jgi:transcriptional regulator with XRE-family HTH domain
VAQKKSIKHHDIVQVVAERIRDRRKQLGMSQQDLAHKAQISLTYAGKLERGESSVGIDMLARIASSMGTSVSALVSDGSETKTNPDAAKIQLKKQIEKLVSRNDAVACQSLSVVVSLMDNALARRNG